MGYRSPGLAISQGFAIVRFVANQLLSNLSAYVRTMAAKTVHYRGFTYLTFFAVSLLRLREHLGSPAFYSTIGSSLLLNFYK